MYIYYFVTRQRLAKVISRGKVDVFIKTEDREGSEREMNIDKGLAAKYHEKIQDLALTLDLPMDLGVSQLIGMPGVMSIDEAAEEIEEVWAQLEKPLEEALEHLLAMRTSEGGRLAGDFLARLDYLEELRARLLAKSPLVVENYRQKLANRIADLLGQQPVDESRLVQEVAMFADRASVEAFVDTCAKTVVEANPADVDALNACKAVGSEMTISELTTEKIQTIGENIKIRRFARYEGAVATYIHAGGSIGVMVKFDTDVADKEGFAEYGKDVAMQVAAANPSYLTEAEVPAEVLEKEKEILKVQAINEGKPEAIAEKMVQGRIKKFYKENCLLYQEFIKDGDQTIKSYTDAKAKELGGKIEIVSFVRFEKGEGIEKRADDFASEVASMMK